MDQLCPGLALPGGHHEAHGLAAAPNHGLGSSLPPPTSLTWVVLQSEEGQVSTSPSSPPHPTPHPQSVLEERPLAELANLCRPQGRNEFLASWLSSGPVWKPLSLLIGPFSEPLRCAKQFPGSSHSGCTMTLRRWELLHYLHFTDEDTEVQGANSLQGSEHASSQVWILAQACLTPQLLHFVMLSPFSWPPLSPSSNFQRLCILFSREDISLEAIPLGEEINGNSCRA